MPHFLIDKKFKINGRDIYCKVTGAPGSAKDGQPFFFMIQGGPGFDHKATIAKHDTFAGHFSDEAAKQPHFIYYDPLGCGQSDQPQDEAAEYTMHNFIEIVATLVEKVKEELGLEKMDLRLYGRSFGSLVAMNLPLQRPQWAEEDSPIRLTQVFSDSGPNGHKERDESLAFLEKHYKDDPDYPVLLASAEKLFAGEIQDQEDYIKNIALALAPLYSDHLAEQAHSFLGQLLKSHPMIMLKLAHAITSVVSIKLLDETINGLEGCNYKLLNYFIGDSFGDMDTAENIKANPELYRKISICCVAADLDYIANSEYHAKKMADALPDHIGLVVFHAKHEYSPDYPEQAAVVHKGLMADGKFDTEYLNAAKPVIAYYHLPPAFVAQLATLKHRVIPDAAISAAPQSLFSQEAVESREKEEDRLVARKGI